MNRLINLLFGFLTLQGIEKKKESKMAIDRKVMFNFNLASIKHIF